MNERFFSLSCCVIWYVCSSVNSPWFPSPASFPRPACRRSSGAPCCTCQTADWAKTAAPPQPMASTAAPLHFTTSSPPRARRTGGSWTSWVLEQIRSQHLIPLKLLSRGLSGFRWCVSAVLCVCHVCEDWLYSVKLVVCNLTITERLKYRLLAQISGHFPVLANKG